MGTTYQRKGDFPKAIEYLEAGVAANRDIFGYVSPEVALSTMNLAAAYYQNGDFKIAFEKGQDSYLMAKMRMTDHPLLPEIEKNFKIVKDAWLDDGECLTLLSGRHNK